MENSNQDESPGHPRPEPPIAKAAAPGVGDGQQSEEDEEPLGSDSVFYGLPDEVVRAFERMMSSEEPAVAKVDFVKLAERHPAYRERIAAIVSLLTGLEEYLDPKRAGWHRARSAASPAQRKVD